jgi:hypothetical protein
MGSEQKKLRWLISRQAAGTAKQNRQLANLHASSNNQ